MLQYTITWYISNISRSHTLNLLNALKLDKNGQCGLIGTCSSEMSDVVLTFLGINNPFLAYCFSWFQLLDSSLRIALYILKPMENSGIIIHKMQNHAVKQKVWRFFFHWLVKFAEDIWFHVWLLTPKIISAPKMSKSRVAKAAVNLIVKMR